MCIGLHVKYRLFWSDINETWNFRHIFKKIPIKFHENLSSGSRVDSCWQKDARTDRRTDRETDMTKLIGAFGSFANVPNRWTPTQTALPTGRVISLPQGTGGMQRSGRDRIEWVTTWAWSAVISKPELDWGYWVTPNPFCRYSPFGPLLFPSPYLEINLGLN